MFVLSSPFALIVKTTLPATIGNRLESDEVSFLQRVDVNRYRLHLG